MRLDKYQASVLAFLFECLPIKDDVETLEFSLTGSFPGKFSVGYGAIAQSDQPANIVFTIPTYSHRVFLALSRTGTIETARLIANLEDYERESSRALNLGEVVVTPDQFRNETGTPFGVILLRTKSSFDCANVPDSCELNGIKTTFFLVIPLTKMEHEILHLNGHDALMDKFQAEQKDIFF